MWPFKNEPSVALANNVAEVVQETAEAILPKKSAPFPSAVSLEEPEISSDEMDEYMGVVKSVGIDCCSAVIEEKLRRCLCDEGISRYDTDQVIEYLDEQLGKNWVWKGLRTVDAKYLKNWHTDGQIRNVQFGSRPYTGTIPLPVLLTIEKVQKAVPEVFFYISAPKEDEGDPFLLVTSRHIGSYIIERWNEPNFRER